LKRKKNGVRCPKERERADQTLPHKKPKEQGGKRKNGRSDDRGGACTEQQLERKE